MPTMISIEFVIFNQRAVSATGVDSSFCLYINNGMCSGLSVGL